MTTKEFDYNLPEELIAQTPIKNRSESKLMILDKKTNKPTRIYHDVDSKTNKKVRVGKSREKLD